MQIKQRQNWKRLLHDVWQRHLGRVILLQLGRSLLSSILPAPSISFQVEAQICSSLRTLWPPLWSCLLLVFPSITLSQPQLAILCQEPIPHTPIARSLLLPFPLSQGSLPHFLQTSMSFFFSLGLPLPQRIALFSSMVQMPTEILHIHLFLFSVCLLLEYKLSEGKDFVYFDYLYMSSS